MIDSMMEMHIKVNMSETTMDRDAAPFPKTWKLLQVET